MKGGEELNMSWCKTYAVISIFYLKEGGQKEDDVGVEERSSLQRGVPAIQGYYFGESYELLTSVSNKVEEPILQNHLGYDPRRSNGSFLKQTAMFIAIVAVWVAIVVYYSEETKKEGNRLSERGRRLIGKYGGDCDKDIRRECYGRCKALVLGRATVKKRLYSG